ncbi:methylated-DNA--[protein]-cysteine S-methyltransferase [Aquimarina intermedia]|uniref:Methylated-DNA--protein-cysteine methyltransferase n=1 Tax=Aquimarina intermedia TaxID=350814 RepID=A0A5S5CA89_9FLAO|nr:methylated-DNA--[protein]-cysteine S-methyltransferase [Aquimarina intermedia]TYP76227.1 methylated-DNA-[protein]-cysteine S-methyltransferase [Aquimarina intermedia]
MKMNPKSKRYFTTVETPLGKAYLVGDAIGLTAFTVGEIVSSALCNKELPPYFDEAIKQVKEYFDGRRKTFDLPLHPSGTSFQKKVWAALSKIPYGQTVSYLDVAKQLGDPKVIRAAASANGKNPLWIIVPCHRVIGSDGSLTGYAGGLWRKKWLLEHESPYTQQRLF